MIEHASEWLGAYLDGELHGLRLQQVESHLTECAACRSELESLRNLSTLLQDTGPAEQLTTTERFVTNLTLSLPRRSEAPLRRKTSSIGWWLVPVGLLGIWVFIQTLTVVTSLVTSANDIGLFGSAAAWMQSGTQHTDWFAVTQGLFGKNIPAIGRTTLEILDQVNVLSRDFLTQLVWQVAFALLYWTWLASWLIRRQRKIEPSGGHRFPRASSQS